MFEKDRSLKQKLFTLYEQDGEGPLTICSGRRHRVAETLIRTSKEFTWYRTYMSHIIPIF